MMPAVILIFTTTSMKRHRVTGQSQKQVNQVPGDGVILCCVLMIGGIVGKLKKQRGRETFNHLGGSDDGYDRPAR